MIFADQNFISNRLSYAKSTGELIIFGFSDRLVRRLISANFVKKRLHFPAHFRSQSQFRTQRKSRRKTNLELQLTVVAKSLDVVFAALSVSNNTSAGPSTHSTAADSIRYYHVISVGVICFLIGAITSFVILIHCQHITTALRLDHKPAAAAAVSMATADKRRDVMVTSQGCGATVIRTASISDKMRTAARVGDDDVFSAARSSISLSNGSSQTALVHLRQYYRRHYTGGVADTTYCRT